MPLRGPGPLMRAWLRWRSLRLPWRRKFLVGMDLSGNTFWEFKDRLNATRLRRIVKYKNTTQYSEVKITPQWHQWLRRVRETPPSIAEQQQDLVRLQNVKTLAQSADEMWARKPSLLENPNKELHPSQLEASEPEVHPKATYVDKSPGVKSVIAGGRNIGGRLKGGPSENWQPEPWTPKPTPARS